MKIALTIAGSDPTGGAGLQADLRTFRSMGVYGLGVPSALTAQNTEGVHSIQELSPDFFTAQIDTLLRDIHPDALKTGMLYTSENIRIVSDKVKEYNLKNLVVDTVTVSSSGVSLIEDRALEVMKNDLFPVSRVITPNIYEASVLTGREIESVQDMKDAAVRLKDFGPGAVIITGGHLEKKADDLLFDGEEFMTLENRRIEGEYHGTGCVFSSVVTACLAMDCGVQESFIRAKEFVWDAMKSSLSLGKGMKILHF